MKNSVKSFWILLSSFLIIFVVNTIFWGDFSRLLFGMIGGDINKFAQFDFYRFLTIIGALTIETLFLSGAVFITSKNFFNDETTH